MLGWFLLFSIWVILGPKIQGHWITPNLYWAISLYLWLLHLLGLSYRISAKKYRYAIPWFFIFFSALWILVVAEKDLPYLDLWTQIFILGIAIGHGLLMVVGDNLVNRASVRSHAWLLLHNLLFILASGWFLLFHKLFWTVFLILVIAGGVSLYLGLLYWNKKSTIGTPKVDASSLLFLSAVYFLILAGIIKFVYLYHLDFRIFLSVFLGIISGLIGVILILGEGMKQRVKTWVKILFGYEQVDIVKEWDDFVSTIEDLMDEEEIIDRVRDYLRERYGVKDVILFWKDNDVFWGKDRKIALSSEAERYMWYKDAVILPEELWRYGVKLDMIESGDLIVPMIFRKSLVGFLVLKQAVRAKLSAELAIMIARNLAVMLTLAKLSREVLEMRQFEQFNKMVSFLIHDIKNTLSGLELLVANWNRNKNNPEFLKDAYATLLATTKKMEHVLERLNSHRLDRVSSGKKEWVDVLGVLEDIIRDLNLKSTRIEIVLENKGSPKFLCDRGSLVRIVENLLLNAVDAVKEKGEGKVYISVEDVPGEIIIAVQDEGIGMDQDFIRRKLFKPFVSTKKRGLGIGMYEVKTLVEAMGGKISVQSQVGIGSRIEVRLPKMNEVESKDETSNIVSR